MDNSVRPCKLKIIDNWRNSKTNYYFVLIKKSCLNLNLVIFKLSQSKAGMTDVEHLSCLTVN